MKQQIIKLKKKLLLVELPEGYDTVYLEDNKKLFYKNLYMEGVGAPHIIWLLEESKKIGKLTDITEEQFEKWVDGIQRDDYELFWKYTKPKDGYWLETAKESFFSKLEAEEIYFSNPHDKPEDHFYTSYWEKENGEQEWNEAISEWQEAESKVWNKDNTYIFEIL